MTPARCAWCQFDDCTGHLNLVRPPRRVVYLSGPMTGYFDYNYPAFHAAAAAWRRAGWEVLNPAENFGGRQDCEYSAYLREDVTQLLQATAIAMLYGWQESTGARLELAVAQAIGLELYYADVPGQAYIHCPTITTAVAPA